MSLAPSFCSARRPQTPYEDEERSAAELSIASVMNSLWNLWKVAMVECGVVMVEMWWSGFWKDKSDSA